MSIQPDVFGYAKSSSYSVSGVPFGPWMWSRSLVWSRLGFG